MKFKRMREEMGLSREALARKLGVSTSYITTMETEPTDELRNKMVALYEEYKGVVK